MPINTLDPDESQGLLGHFTGRIEQSFWSSPLQEAPADNKPDFDGADRLRLYWHVNITDVLQADYDGNVPESLMVNWSIGKGWWATENGLYVHHNDDAPWEEIEAGKATPKTFHINSGLGMFLGLLKGSIKEYENDFGPAIPLDGDGELEYDLNPGVRQYLVRSQQTDTRDSTIWYDMNFEFRGSGLRWDRDRKPRMQTRPFKFLGTSKGDSGEVGSSSKPAQAANPNPAADTATWVELGATEDTAGTLVKLAAASSSHTDFQHKALLVPAVKDDDALSTGVMDEENWSQ